MDTNIITCYDNVSKEALNNFITEAWKQNWDNSIILAQIRLFCTGYRGVQLSDLAIILIDGERK